MASDSIFEVMLGIANSKEIQDYESQAKKVKPGHIFSRARRHFSDSIHAPRQTPALYATLSRLGENKQARILYVASSYGLGIKMISEAGFTSVYGLDIDRDAVKFCNSQGLSTIVGDATSVCFPDSSFDMVLSKDLIDDIYVLNDGMEQDIDRLVAALNEMYRITKEGGHIVFTTGTKKPVYMGTPSSSLANGVPSNYLVEQSDLSKATKSRDDLEIKANINLKFPILYFQK